MKKVDKNKTNRKDKKTIGKSLEGIFVKVTECDKRVFTKETIVKKVRNKLGSETDTVSWDSEKKS